MYFNNEQQMTEDFVDFIRSKFDERINISINEQVSVGYGIADLVITVHDDNYKKQNFQENILTKSDINVLSLIDRSGTIELKELQEITRLNFQKLLDIKKKLIERNFIHDSKKEELSIKNRYEFPFRYNIAVEMKISNWKRALNQARRYKWFSEYSFVVIDNKSRAAAERNLDLFKKHSVGLASFSKNGVFDLIYKPKFSNPLSNNMTILYSEKFVLNH